MKYTLFFLLLIIIANQVVSQQTGKPVVYTASYFDISPPLREMCIGIVNKADQSWKDGYVKNFFNVSNHSPCEGLNTDSIAQTSSGIKSGDSIMQNFEGLSNLNWLVPPDPCGDAGPDHYFQMVNVSCAIYNKAGTKILGPFNSGSIWNGMPNNSSNGDGIVLYDENANRWFISQFSLPNLPNGPFYQMIAVSQTPDPTGSWFRWEFVFSDLPDYPKFGIWYDGYYMSCNRFGSGGFIYNGTGVAVFERAAMLNGDPAARMISFQPNSGNDAFSVMPADCDGDFPNQGTPEYFFFIKRNYLGVTEFHTDWNNPVNSTYDNYLRIPVSPFANNIGGIPQKGTDISLLPVNDRLMFRVQFRKFDDHQSLVLNHTVDIGTRSGIRLYELRRTTENWYIHQQSTYVPDSNFRWMGSIAMDQSGNIALGYSVSGSNLYPSIRFTGRMAHDPLNQFTIAEKEIIPGGGAQTGVGTGGGRWGDYSSMNVDPVQPQTFWYTQEYFDSTSVRNWKTRIASFSFAKILTINAMAIPSVICMGGSCNLNIVASGGTGNYSYNWSSVPPGFSSNDKDPLAMPLTTTKFIAKVNDGLSVCIDTLTVGILTPPSVSSGNDGSYCTYLDRIQLQGMASNIISIKWITSGDGIFSDETNLNTIYFPGIFDKSLASVSLKLIGIPQPPCSQVSSVKHIIFEPCAGIGEWMSGTSLIEVFPNPCHGQFYIRMIGFSSSPVSVQLFNPIDEVALNEVFDYSDSSQILKVNLSQYSSGIFVLKVKTNDRIMFKKIILQN